MRAKSESSDRVRVFTIAYSPDAIGAESTLKSIAIASGGAAYGGTTADIEGVYRRIGSYF